MRSRLPVLVVVLAAACGNKEQPPAASETAAATPTAAQPAAEDVATRYARAMDQVGARLEADIETWAKTAFATRAEAFEAMMQLTPASPRTQQHMRAALTGAGLSWDELASFMDANPEVAATVAKRLEQRLDAAFERHEDRVAAIEKLPPGDMDGAQKRVMAMMRATPPPPVQTTVHPLSDWTPVTKLAELQVEAAAAAAAKQPVILHLTAAWCTPCKELEQTTFADAGVKARLRTYRRLYIDVSNGTDDDEAVQQALDTENLPAVLVYTDPAALAAHLAGSGARPAPTARIDRSMDAATFLTRLPAD